MGGVAETISYAAAVHIPGDGPESAIFRRIDGLAAGC
jgi:hypothetical protein